MAEAAASPEMTGGPNELTNEEVARLAELRAVIDKYVEAELKAARALREIRDDRLWKKDSESWSAYCRDFLPVTKRRADQLIKFARLRDEWEPGFPPPPANERQARHLYGLSAEERAHVAQRVDEDSGGVGFKGVSAERVRKIAEEVSDSVGAELVPLDQRGLVLVSNRRGVRLIKRGWVLRLLTALAEAAAKMAGLGPYAIEDAVRGIPEEDGEKRREQVWVVASVAARLVSACTERWPEGPSASGQERWMMPWTGLAGGDGAAEPGRAPDPAEEPV
jgi:hypothetical protein